MRRLVLLLGIIWAFCQISACQAPPAKYSGFLGDYSGLQPAADGNGSLVYRKPGLSLSAYHEIMLDPIELWLSPSSDPRGINPDELKLITAYFREAISKKLGRTYPLAKDPGVGVLRVRIAVTGVEPMMPQRGIGGQVPATYVQLKLRDAAARNISGLEISMEAELLDAETDERLMAVVEKRSSSNLPVGPPSWEYAKGVLDYWANQLRLALDEAHDRPGPDSHAGKGLQKRSQE